MERKPLKDYFDKIVDYCADGAEAGGFDEDGYDYRTNYICFDIDGYHVEGSFELAGKYTEDGDGYWTPYETYLSHVKISVDQLEVSWCDPDTEEEEEVPEEEIKALRSYIEDNVPSLVAD